MMNYRRFAIPALMLALAAGCDEDNGVTSPTAESFTATLNGANERPTPVTTPGAGTANFTLSADGNTLSWTVTITGMNNVTAAHIHIGGREVAGPVEVGLFGGPTTNNPPISGSVTRATFVSPLGLSFDSVLSLMRSGDTYVNVHTNNGVAPTNTGPGDFPAGEIRGQIARAP